MLALALARPVATLSLTLTQLTLPLAQVANAFPPLSLPLAPLALARGGLPLAVNSFAHAARPSASGVPAPVPRICAPREL
jgi:hypothetical protein